MEKTFNELTPKMQELLFEMVESTLKRKNTIHDLKFAINMFDKAISNFFTNKEYTKKFKKLVCDCFKSIDRYSQDEYRFFQQDSKRVINQGLQMDEDGTSWMYWYLIEGYNKKEVENFINKYGYQYGIYFEADEIHSAYDCTGRAFSGYMNLKKVGKGSHGQDLFLATKSYGLDV